MSDATAGKATSPAQFAGISRNRAIVLGLLAFAVFVTLFKPWLPGFLDRLPEEWIPPWADWLDAGVSWLQNDLGLIHVTREISSWLGFLIDAAANLLYGKSRWPRMEMDVFNSSISSETATASNSIRSRGRSSV